MHARAVLAGAADGLSQVQLEEGMVQLPDLAEDEFAQVTSKPKNFLKKARLAPRSRAI